jgi:hypothetical protein
MMRIFEKLIDAIHPFRTRMVKHNCWICDTQVEFHPDEIQHVNHQFTLGRGMSYTACAECRSRRSSTPDELTNTIVGARTAMSILPEDTEWELTEAQWARVEAQLGFYDVDGQKYGLPVHFWHEGRYYTVREWLSTEGHLKEMERAKIRYRDWWSRNTADEVIPA